MAPTPIDPLLFGLFSILPLLILHLLHHDLHSHSHFRTIIIVLPLIALQGPQRSYFDSDTARFRSLGPYQEGLLVKRRGY